MCSDLICLFFVLSTVTILKQTVYIFSLSFKSEIWSPWGNTQINKLYKDFAFIFLASDKINKNLSKVLIDRNRKMFEVGILQKIHAHGFKLFAQGL